MECLILVKGLEPEESMWRDAGKRSGLSFLAGFGAVTLVPSWGSQAGKEFPLKQEGYVNKTDF